MRVTDHAIKMMRQRLGLPKKAAQREAARAWSEGIQADALPVHLRRYCAVKEHAHKSRARLYHAHLYFFSPVGTLVTVYPLPPKYRHYLAALQGRAVAGAHTSDNHQEIH
tara:strand:+ start:1923 stop:2252 length:330 start_codon:yes stop_codon:yes gene_type:complete